ncbi:hypothetical protein ACH3XW_5170 [Acanthocheilonema viteae]
MIGVTMRLMIPMHFDLSFRLGCPSMDVFRFFVAEIEMDAEYEDTSLFVKGRCKQCKPVIVDVPRPLATSVIEYFGCNYVNE